MKNDVNLYVQFTKTNDEEQIVEGIATSEDLDSQGEIVKYDAIKDALPDYMKFGNIREMHQYSAVGKAIKAIPDDAKKNLLLTAKVIDPIAWQKVKEGVYNGFSIGGRVLKQVGNEIQGITLNEISLVDRPANPAALFSLVKFDKGGDGMKDLKKAVDAEETDSADAKRSEENREIFRATYLLEIAADLCYLYDMYDMNGLDTSDLEAAIDSLKLLAVKHLTDDKETAQKITDMLSKFQNRKNFAEEEQKTQESEVAKLNAEIRQANTKNFIKQDAWVEDYFTTMRKVLG